MKKAVFNSGEQNKNENSNLFNFPVENKMEVLNQYQMNQIKGGDGGEDEVTNQEWE